jgi:hypothetical protein
MLGDFLGNIYLLIFNGIQDRKICQDRIIKPRYFMILYDTLWGYFIDNYYYSTIHEPMFQPWKPSNLGGKSHTPFKIGPQSLRQSFSRAGW